MERDELNRYLIPASRWQNFPILKSGLKGNWACWKEEERDYARPSQRKTAFYIGEIGRRQYDTVRVDYKELKLHEVWVIPGHVPLELPRYEWGGPVSKPLTVEQLVEVLAAGLARVDAEPWAEREEVPS